MISTPDRQRAVSLIDEARAAGARLKPSCGMLGTPPVPINAGLKVELRALTGVPRQCGRRLPTL